MWQMKFIEKGLSEDAQKQLNKSEEDDYKSSIQCCGNCNYWGDERLIMSSEKYVRHICLCTTNEYELSYTPLNCWCPKYDGTIEGHNLAYKEAWEKFMKDNGFAL